MLCCYVGLSFLLLFRILSLIKKHIISAMMMPTIVTIISTARSVRPTIGNRPNMGYQNIISLLLDEFHSICIKNDVFINEELVLHEGLGIMSARVGSSRLNAILAEESGH